ncbi:MAG: protein phosphatase CheZ [Deltaproteobacteria bacterium]|nr:protein phosphatase CheZ [Deltaproteobacteria bacterium]
MAGLKPPEINLELSDGTLTIRTAEAVYNVTVRGSGSSLPAPLALPEKPARPEFGLQNSQAAALEDWDRLEMAGAEEPPPPPAAPPDQEYYRDLSHDMYSQVGRLARRLSLSIRDVHVAQADNVDFQAAGEQLELAKDQLEDVVKMTERATLRIMDLGEDIQQAIDNARQIMQDINTDSSPRDNSELEAQSQDARSQLTSALAALTDYLGKVEHQPLQPVLAMAQGLAAELQKAGSQAAAAPAPPPPPAVAYSFPLEVLFQTIYELCTNETVKKHIKGMWESGNKEFQGAVVEDQLNQLAVGMAPDADNFLNLSLKEVLKTLFQTTANERFQQVLKKMASTMDQIFLEQQLPLEAVQKPQTAPPPPPPPSGPTLAPESIAQAQALVDQLNQVMGILTPVPAHDNLEQMLDSALESFAASQRACNVVDPSLLSNLEKSVEAVMTSVNSIIEALSFQDLAGQTIYRIVRLLTDFQVQLLAMVVSFGTKLKVKEGSETAVSHEQSEKMAQAEVDKVLGDLKVHDEAATTADGDDPSKLDQGAVNDLLAAMGF